MQRPVGLTMVALLAVAQSLLGALSAFQWFELGSAMSERGILVAPLVGILMMARGGLVVVIALLYVTFSVGALARQGWAWWLGLTVAVLNVSGVLWLVIAGAPLIPTLILAVIPVVLVCYLIAPAGRQALLSRPVAIR